MKKLIGNILSFNGKWESFKVEYAMSSVSKIEKISDSKTFGKGKTVYLLTLTAGKELWLEDGFEVK